MKGYKVVSVCNNGRLRSAVGGYTQITYYLIDGDTIPIKSCGPLTCFRTREAARYFKRSMRRGAELQIWECDFVESEKDSVWVPGCVTPKWILVYRNSHLLDDRTCVLADRIRLLRRVR